MAAAMVACGDDNEEEEAIIKPSDDFGKELKDPYEAKQYLQETGESFLQLFNPKDQEEFIDVVNYFCENFGDLDMDFDTDTEAPVTSMMKALRKGFQGGNYTSLSRATYYYEYAFKDFTGIYEPGRYEWRKVADSNDIIFRWEDHGTKVEAKAVASGGSYDVDYSIEDYDWYDGYYTENYQLTIPKKVVLTLIKGNVALLTSTNNTDYSSKNHTISINTDTQLANLQIKATVSGTDSKVTSNAGLYVNNDCVLVADAIVNGKNLCNKNAYENADDDEIADFFTNGSATVNVLGRVQVKADCKNLRQIVEASDYDDYEDYNPQAKNDAANLAKVLNSNATASIYYSGSDVKQADIIWDVVREDDWGYTYWYVEPLIKFCADDSKYSFEEYFGGNRFSNVVDELNDLIESYERYW